MLMAIEHPPWVHNKKDEPLPFYRVGELKRALRYKPHFWRAVVLCPFHALMLMRPGDEAWIHAELISQTCVEYDLPQL